jgi:multicomponent Na+:H+ antiporter subunit D
MKGSLFLVAANLRKRFGHSDIDRIDSGMIKKLPWTTAAFTVSALSMIGIPPMAGFFSKWYLALGAIDRGNGIFLAVIMASSLLNAVYFFRVLERIYLKKTPDRAAGSEIQDGAYPEAGALKLREGYLLTIPVVVLSFSLILIGLFNSVFVKGIIQNIIPPGM